MFALASIDGEVFAGLYAKGLFGSNESEEKWAQIGRTVGIKPLALAVSEGALIAGHNPGGIYWSGDRGGSWERWLPLEASGSPSTFDSILSGAADPAKMTTLPLIDAPIWEMTADSRIAIAGAGVGVYFSGDRGPTWTRATKGLPANGPGIAFHIGNGIIFRRGAFERDGLRRGRPVRSKIEIAWSNSWRDTRWNRVVGGDTN